MSDALASSTIERGALVHFMAGDADCLALITSRDYRTPHPPSDLEIAPLMVVQPMQALLVWPPMQAPFWRTAQYDKAFAPNTWHWPEDHLPPPEPPKPALEPELYVGEIVHYAEGLTTHMAAIVVNVVDMIQQLADLAVFNGQKHRVDFVYNVPRDQTGFSNVTWHRIRFEGIPEHHSGPLYAAPDPIVEE